MKKTIALAVPAILFVVFIIAFAIVQANQPQDWESALQRYLVHESVFASANWKVKTVITAQYPWNFTETMSAAAIAESIHFDTITYEASAAPTATDDFILGKNQDSRKAPLPYPPTDIWCVVLKQNGNEQEIIFVALHEDLYNAEIVIHEPAKQISDEAFLANLTKIGCELP